MCDCPLGQSLTDVFIVLHLSKYSFLKDAGFLTIFFRFQKAEKKKRHFLQNMSLLLSIFATR